MVRLVGSSVSSFTWSTSEQVYPFEKDVNGNTLYCKEVDFGALPNNGLKSVAHGVGSFSSDNLFKAYGTSSLSGGTQGEPIPQSYNSVDLYIDTTNINCRTQSDRTSFTAKIRLIYKK